MVGVTGIEPVSHTAQHFKCCVFTYFTTPPYKVAFGDRAPPWIYLLSANQAGSAHDITEPAKELRFYLALLTFNLQQ